MEVMLLMRATLILMTMRQSYDDKHTRCLSSSCIQRLVCLSSCRFVLTPREQVALA